MNGIMAGMADAGATDDGEIDGAAGAAGGATARAPMGLPATDRGDMAAERIAKAMIVAAQAGMAADGASMKVKAGAAPQAGAVVRDGSAAADGVAAATMIEIGSASPAAQRPRTSSKKRASRRHGGTLAF